MGYEAAKRPVEEVTFYRQNKKGKPLKISREKYLRTDINCGVIGCNSCGHTDRSLYKLHGNPEVFSNKFAFKHFLLPDASFLLRQTDVLDELENIILLQTVMEEVYKRNVTKYKHIRNGVKIKSWNYYLNEHSHSTYVSRRPGETNEDRNFREFMECYKYFTEHVAVLGIQVVALSDNPNFKELTGKAGYDTSNLLLATAEEYVTTMKEEFKDLIDKLCLIPFNEDEIMKKYQDFAYPPHLESKIVQAGLQKGTYVQGVYRSRNFYEGVVRIGEKADEKRKRQGEISENEILLQGLDNINRASEGDVVAIEILPKEQWSVPSGIVVVEPVEQEPALTKDKFVLKNEESDADAQEQEDLAEEEEVFAAIAEGTKHMEQKQKTGKVIGIIRRKWAPVCGVVRKSLKEGSTFHFFLPDNKKLPKVRIETRNVDRFEGQKIVAQIDQWPVTSRYPVGHYIKILGPVGCIETETLAILNEHGIPHEAFSKAVEKCLPAKPWSINEDEYQSRRDFRDYIVCSVDPPGCTDIDDALHCSRNDDGTYDVGVHIADVSYFVRPGTALDDEAAKRSTTVYLADRRINMIPPLLSTDLASLHSGTDKLVFSVVWKMTPSAEILDTQFCKGIINSKAAMTYGEAQKRLNSNTEGDPLTNSLKGLSALAQLLKKKRFEKGALALSSEEVNEDGQVEDDEEEAHSMVEEFMLLANCSVAEFILKTFREFSLLRRHPIPPPANFEPLLLAAKAHNLSVIVDQGSKALNESLESQSPEFKTVLRVLTTRCMTQALYYCSGTTSPDEYLHFGLAVELYTHFTSPIRRYADLVVHRLLAIAIEVERPNPRILDSNRIHETCEHINIRHRMAQYAQRASINIHKSKALKGKNEEEHRGYILFVRRNALQVYVPKYCMEGYIVFPKDLEYTYNEKEAQVTIGSHTFRSLDRVVIGLSMEEDKDRAIFRLVSPHIPKLSDRKDEEA